VTQPPHTLTLTQADAAITYRDVWALGADTLVAVGDGNRVLRSR
jgi:hypothetical protein